MIQDVDFILQGRSTAKVAASADADGNVVGFAGEGDGESLCAVGTMCSRALADAGQSLGLGNVRSWTTVGEKVSIFAQVYDQGIVIAAGEASKSSLSNWKEFCKRVEQAVGS